MNISNLQVSKLKSIVSLCRQVGIEIVVISDGKVLGANEARNLAIISTTDLKLGQDLKLGIGRVSDLDKKLALFEEAAAEVKAVNDEIAMLTFLAGKLRAQFRCSSMALLERRYPRGNLDTPDIKFSINTNEVAQLIRTAKTYGAANLVLRIDRTGGIQVHGTSPSNEQFIIDMDDSASFLQQEKPVVFTYSAQNLCQVLDLAVKDMPRTELIIGEAGSTTVVVKGHSIVVAPSVNEE